jgi:hypothetical protein
MFWKKESSEGEVTGGQRTSKASENTLVALKDKTEEEQEKQTDHATVPADLQ